MKKEEKKIGRREFLKVLGGSALVTSAAMYGCAPKGEVKLAAQGEVPTEGMEYRTSATGDRVSLLGYGCMR